MYIGESEKNVRDIFQKVGLLPSCMCHPITLKTIFNFAILNLQMPIVESYMLTGYG
jgi:hypothetical protein